MTLSLKYSYTDDDKLKTVTYPSGKTISYSYNIDKINGIAIDGNPLITDISYNAANQLTGWTWSDGTAYTKTYDTNGRLKTFPLGDQTRTLNYDKLGNITGWSNSNGESKAFTYDLLSRLTGYTKTQGNQTKESQTFSYDANGNRLNLTKNKDTADEIQTIYTILKNSNRLTKVANTDYQYDHNGNIINDGDHSYTYDARNRLVSIDNGTSASYRYNANNMRVKKTTTNETTSYGWDNDRIFAEYDASGNPIQETVYFGSTPIALLKDGNTYRIFADQIDTPRVITDNTNNTLWVWDSKPFGESQPNEDVDGDNTKLSYNLRFSGQYYDAETGKHYNFNRDYDPVTGRYVQSDPIGLDGGMNGYAYVENNSIRNIDSLGTVLWRGGYFYASGSRSGSGVTYLRFQLYQQGNCRNPWKVEVNVSTYTFSIGVPLSVSGGQVEFYSPDASCPANPYVFNGSFKAVWASFVVGTGYGIVKFQLGSMTSGWLRGWSGGIDASSGWAVGGGKVKSVQ